MKFMKSLVVLALVAMVSINCGTKPTPTLGGGAGGATTSTTTVSTASTSTTSTTSTTAPPEVVLEPGCVEEYVTGPIAATDGLKTPGGVAIHEDGAVAVRCYENPDPTKPFVLTEVSYAIEYTPVYGCTELADHAAFVFGATTIAPTKSAPAWSQAVKIADQGFSNGAAIVSVTVPNVEIQAPFICGGIVLPIVNQDKRVCFTLCGDQPTETPDPDRWSVVGLDGKPVCTAAGACDLVSLDSSPSAEIGMMFNLEENKIAVRVTGRPKG